MRLKQRLRSIERRSGGGDPLKKVEEREGAIVFAGVHPEIYEQGAGGEKNLAASGQPRPKYRTALRSIARRFFGCQKWWRTRHARKPFSLFERRAKNRTPPFLPIRGRNVPRFFFLVALLTRNDAYFTSYSRAEEFLSRELGNQRSLVSINTPRILLSSRSCINFVIKLIKRFFVRANFSLSRPEIPIDTFL